MLSREDTSRRLEALAPTVSLSFDTYHREREALETARDLYAELDAKDAEIAALRTRAETAERERDWAIQQAQVWKQEARTQQATVYEGYQAVTGATGEPGDWNGAEPFKALVRERDEATERHKRELVICLRAMDKLEAERDQLAAEGRLLHKWLLDPPCNTSEVANFNYPLIAAEVARVKRLEAVAEAAEARMEMWTAETYADLRAALTAWREAQL